MNRALGATVALACWAACASTPRAMSSDRPHPAAAVSLAQVAFLSGHWAQESDDEVTEEAWLPPRGDALVGVNRTVKAGRTVFFEHLRLSAEDDGGVTYWASPRGASATPFWLTGADAGWVQFENLGHDFPKRLIYWRAAGSSLCAQIEGDPDAGQRAQQWCWSRVDEP